MEIWKSGLCLISWGTTRMVKFVAISSALHLNSLKKISVVTYVLEQLASDAFVLAHRANQAFCYRSLALEAMCMVHILEVVVFK